MKKGKRVATRQDSMAEFKQATRPKKTKKKGSSLKKAVLILGSILAVFLIGFIVVKYGWKPNVDVLKPPDYGDGDLIHDGIDPANPNSVDDPANPASKAPSTGDATKLTLDGNVRTVLLVGCFDGSNTDTIMMATLNYKEKTVEVISIPRDTTIDYNGKRTKINAVHAYAERTQKGSGLNALAYELSKVLGFMPNAAMYVKMQGFVDAIDAVGGIQFNVPQSISKPEENISLTKGDQLLSGKKALMLVRFRGYGSNNSAGIPNDDYGRMYMQQQFLKAAAKQIIVPKNINKIPDFVEIIEKNVTSTMSATDMLWYAQEVMAVNPDSINFHTLPTSSVDKSYEYVIAEDALALINKTVNPYTKDIPLENLSLSYQK